MKVVITILLFFVCHTISTAQNIEACDSLIKIGVVQLEENDHIKSLDNLNKAFVMATENRWYDQAFLTLNNIGANYYSMLNYGEALHYYLEAYQLAISHLDSNREMIVLNNIAILYLSDHEYIKAAEYGERAFDIARKADNSKRMAIYGVNLGLIYNKIGDLEKAAHFFAEVKKIDFQGANINLINQIGQTENAYLSKNYERALALAKSLLPAVQKSTDRTKLSHLYLLLSKIYLEQNSMSEALQFCNMAIEASPDLESKIVAYQQLTTIYMAQKKFEKAVVVKDTLMRYSDSLNQIKNGKYFESNKLSFEIQKYRQDAANSSLELSQERKFHYTLLGCISLVFLVSVWGFRNSLLKNKHKKEAAEREREIALLELKRRESERLIIKKQILEKEAQQRLERAELKHEIELKNRKLSAKAIYQVERNEILKNIIDVIHEQQEFQDNQTIKKELKKLNELVKTDESWDDFAKHFEAVNQGYLEKLKSDHPSLNSNDLRFLSYLYMNLSQKEIATVLSISPDACRKRKERISKKIGLTDGAELYDYLYSI